MSEVRRERAVELAYEGHRFNDLRRWLLLTKYPYNVKTGIKFDRDVPETNDATPTNVFLDKVNPENNKINNLKEYVVLERLYSDKHYWLPLKQVGCKYLFRICSKSWLVIAIYNRKKINNNEIYQNSFFYMRNTYSFLIENECTR